MNRQSTQFWLIALAGMLVFAAYLSSTDIPARIKTAEQAEAALQALDELRDPLLAIEESELAEDFLRKNLDTSHNNFKQQESRLQILISAYRQQSRYNPALSESAETFVEAAGTWFQHERELWLNEYTNARKNIETPPAVSPQYKAAMKHYFTALRSLTDAEHLIHDDLKDGSRAAEHLWFSGFALILYLFLLIIVFQRYRQGELLNAYVSLNQAHEQIEEREQHLSRTLDSIGDAVMATDDTGRITRLNPIAEVLTGWRASEAEGQPLEKVFHIINAITRDTVENPVEKVLLTGKVVGLANHTVLISRSGAEHQIADSGAPITDRDGNIQGVILVFRDVTEEYRMQEELRDHRDHLETLVRERTEDLETTNRELTLSNRELESFSYSVSHDLRAPLRSIHGFSSALLEDYAARVDETGRSYLQRVCSAARRMDGLIDDMLRLSQVTRSNMTINKVDLTQLAQSIVAVLQEESPERDVHFKVQPGMTGNADSHLLKIAFENLIGNAWKYTEKETQASIEIGMQAGDETVYWIRDNGVGFDMNHSEKLFGVFQRLHGAEFEGTGVGLATVERIIHRHGGRIWAEAQQGEGATFFFTLGNYRKPRLQAV